MIRKPRFPLALRLAWLESEVDSAARLAHMMVTDMRELRAVAGAAEARTLLTASLASAALLMLGVEPALLHAFVVAVGPDGDMDEAEALGAEILAEAMLRVTPGEGGLQ